MDQANRTTLLTPAGSAAIAVVRVVGPRVATFFSQHFSQPLRLGRAVHGELRDGQRLIDDPVVVLVAEDAADINLHGGSWVVHATLELLAREGFVLLATKAESSPLPADAVEAADPLLSEVLTHLPLARTEPAVRMLLAQPTAWKALLSRRPPRSEIEAIFNDQTMQRLLFPPRVAIVGAANVGKSTLANQLFGQERSLTADMPGTTRDWVGELADIDGLAVMLVDTPGLRASQDQFEQQAIAVSHAQAEAAEVIVVVIDAGRPLDAEQLAPLDRYPAAIVAINKTDQPAVFNVEALAAHNPIRIAARTGAGLDALRRRILRRLGCDLTTTERPLCWTERQRVLLEAML